MSERVDPERLRDFARRLFGHLNGAVTSALVYLGDELGLYRALAEGGPATSAELGGARGPRRALGARVALQPGRRGPARGARGERFALSAEGRAVLAEESHPAFGAGMFSQLPKTLGVAELLRDSFRTGVGLPVRRVRPRGRARRRARLRAVGAELPRARGDPARARASRSGSPRAGAWPTSAAARASRCSCSRTRSRRLSSTATSSRVTRSRVRRRTAPAPARRTCTSTTCARSRCPTTRASISCSPSTASTT